MQNYLTTYQAANVLGMGPHAIRKLVKDGRLAVHYLGPKGGLIRFTEADLSAYLESCRSFGSRAALRPKASRRQVRRSVSTESTHPDAPINATPKHCQRRAEALRSRTTPESNED